jgi:hypothetical protein
MHLIYIALFSQSVLGYLQHRFATVLVIFYGLVFLSSVPLVGLVSGFCLGNPLCSQQ